LVARVTEQVHGVLRGTDTARKGRHGVVKGTGWWKKKIQRTLTMGGDRIKHHGKTPGLRDPCHQRLNRGTDPARKGRHGVVTVR
jgi:hypothetical protein